MSLLKDKRVRLAFFLGFVEWVVLSVGALAFGWDSLPVVSVILVTTTFLQMGLLFFRKRPTGPLATAQTHFMAGDYAESVAILEAVEDKDTSTMTLLGNSYRMMNRLSDGETWLRSAVDLASDDPFPLYGLGRVLLANGDFVGAAELIGQALAHGGRKALRVELALAYHLAGDFEHGQAEAKRAARILGLEPHRIWMVNALLALGGDSLAWGILERHATGRAYWEAEIDRYPESTYSLALKSTINQVETVQEPHKEKAP